MKICNRCSKSENEVSFKTKIDTPACMAVFCVPCRRVERRLKYQRTNGKVKHLEASSRHAKSVKGKAVKRRWRENNPEKYKVHGIVAYAIKKGELIKQPCEVCRATKVEAHHDDYSKPLDVRWLCSKHHKEHHNL